MFAFSQIEPRRSGQLLNADISLPKYLGASFEQGLHDQMFASVYRMEEMGLARQGDMIDAETANKKFALPNLKFTEPVYAEEAQLIYDRKKAESWRDYVLSQGTTGVGRLAVGLPVAMVANMLSPVDLATAFVPIAKVPATANILGRGAMPTLTRGIVNIGGTGFKHRLGVSLVEGTVGNAIAEIPLFAANSQDFTQYTLKDSAVNVLLGGAFAGGLRLGLEGAGRALHRVMPETRRVMEREAANKFLRDEVVDHLQKIAALDKKIIAHEIKTKKAYGEAEAHADVDAAFKRILEEPDHMKQAKEIFDMPVDEFLNLKGFNALTDSIGVAIGKMNVPATQLQLAQMMTWISSLKKRWNELKPLVENLKTEELDGPLMREFTAISNKGQFFSEIIEVIVGIKPEFIRKKYPNYVAQFKKEDVSPDLINTERERRVKELIEWRRDEELGMNAPHDPTPKKPLSQSDGQTVQRPTRYNQKLPRGVKIRGIQSIPHELPPAVGAKIEDVHKEIQKVEEQVTKLTEELKESDVEMPLKQTAFVPAPGDEKRHQLFIDSVFGPQSDTVINVESGKTKQITAGKTGDKIGDVKDVTSQSRRGFLSTLGKALAAVGVTPVSMLKGGAKTGMKKFFMIPQHLVELTSVKAKTIYSDPKEALDTVQKILAEYVEEEYHPASDNSIQRFYEIMSEKYGLEDLTEDQDYALEKAYMAIDELSFIKLMSSRDPLVQTVQDAFTINVMEGTSSNPLDLKATSEKIDIAKAFFDSLPSEEEAFGHIKTFLTTSGEFPEFHQLVANQGAVESGKAKQIFPPVKETVEMQKSLQGFTKGPTTKETGSQKGGEVVTRAAYRDPKTGDIPEKILEGPETSEKSYSSKIDELEIAANCLLFTKPMTVGFKLPRGVKIKGIKERE